jgi:hypothetical protein
MRSETKTLILALRILARDIKAPDDIPECCLREAAERLEELDDAGDLQTAERALRTIHTWSTFYRDRPGDHEAALAMIAGLCGETLGIDKTGVDNPS